MAKNKPTQAKLPSEILQAATIISDAIRDTHKPRKKKKMLRE